MRERLLLAITAIGLALPGRAAAEPRIDLTAGVAFRHVGGALYPVADTESLWMPSLGGGLRLLSIGDLSLHADVAVQAGATGGHTFQAIETELTVKRMLAGVRADLALHSRVRGYARAMVGTEWAVLALSSDPAGSMRDRAWAATATATAGLDVLLIRVPNRRYTIRLRLDASYTRTSALSFRPHPSGGDLAIALAGADLGTLELSGAGGQLGLALEL